MIVIELTFLTYYNNIYMGFYRKSAYFHFCTDINCATKFDKVEADCIMVNGFPTGEFAGWTKRPVMVT